MRNPTVKQTIAAMRRRLNPIYGRGETRDMIRAIFEYLRGWRSVDLIIHEGDVLDELTLNNIRKIEARLAAHEPLQYITGVAHFYGMDFTVDPRVLIPRPETAEMVDMIISTYRRSLDLRVLDIATGSGCVAIALARNLPFSQVEAIDVSADALEVARTNAKRLHCRVNFQQADMADYQPVPQSVEIVVSNPPYVLESEKGEMEPNVLDHEPHLALFVPDDDALKFHKQVARIAKTALKPGGRLYMEINPLKVQQIREMLAEMGFTQIEMERDIHGRERFAIACQGSDE